MTEQELFNALSQNALLLTGNRRLWRGWRQSYAEHQRAQGIAAWSTPSIETWEDWVRAAFDGALDPSTAPGSFAERRLWHAVIARMEGADALLDMEATAAAAVQARALCHQYRIPLTHPAFSDTADSDRFRAWALEFDDVCRSRGLRTEASLDEWFAASLSASPPMLARQTILAGFDEITPSRRAVLDALSPAHTAYTFYAPHTERNSEAFRKTLPSAREELYAAACWARQLLEQGEAVSVGIVPVNLADMRAAADSIFSSVLGAPLYNISLGLPLSEWPLAAAALGWLKWVDRAVSWAEAGQLLRSPYFAGGIDEFSRRSKLEFALGRDNANRPSLAAAGARATSEDCPAMARLAADSRAAFEKLPARQSPAAWARSFHQLLQAAGWPGDRLLDSAEAQTLDAWHGLLRGLASLDAVEGVIDYREALRLLESLAAETIFQPVTPTVPVQILDSLQAAGSQFDALWVAGLDDSRWPARSNPDPFLPRQLQRQENLPNCSPERTLAFARLVTSRLLGSAPRVVCSHAATEKDHELRPSPLILSLPEMESTPKAFPTPARSQFRTGELESFEDAQAPPMPAGAKAAGGAGILKAQSACPFQAFATHRLRAAQNPQPEPGLTALEQGEANHAALAGLWREMQSSVNWQQATREQQEAALDRAIGSAYAGISATGRRKLIAIDKQRLRNLLTQWLAVDLARPEFTVVAIEQPRDPAVPIKQLRADRIDRTQDGSEILIDYKSSSPGPNAWTGERPDDLQLPLYAISAAAPPAAIVFAQVKPGGCKWEGLAAAEGLLPKIKPPAGIDWQQQLDDWRKVIESLWKEFASGHAPVDPKDDGAPCENCHLHSLCRIADRSPQGTGEPA